MTGARHTSTGRQQLDEGSAAKAVLCTVSGGPQDKRALGSAGARGGFVFAGGAQRRGDVVAVHPADEVVRD